MKILITILMALFMSSTANANSIKYVCDYQEEQILSTYGIIKSFINMRVKAYEDKDKDKIKEVNRMLDRADILKEY
jgi:hypothetical protein